MGFRTDLAFGPASHSEHGRLRLPGLSRGRFGEVRREILRHGADVEVLSPPELREEVKKEIKRMEKIYR